MRARQIIRVVAFTASRCRRSYATGRGPRPIPILPDTNLTTFRQHAFEPARPYLLPRSSHANLPAIEKWFLKTPIAPSSHNNLSPTSPPKTSNRPRVTLNREYFLPFGSVRVPLEITNDNNFCRIDSTLSFFLECIQASSSKYIRAPSRYFSSYTPGARAIKPTAPPSQNFFSNRRPASRVYLAQASINDLPRLLRQDLPTPELVTSAGKGDVYDSSVWLGEAPTYTPLHRDPNPNLLVQLAGVKIVRLMSPESGHAVFARVQEEIGGTGVATMRGEEMMQGEEKLVLEKAVWDEESDLIPKISQAKLYAGDALFIPKGWWHSVKGVGHGMTGSANWWFR